MTQSSQTNLKEGCKFLEVTEERDIQDVFGFVHKGDMRWRFTDAKGHKHKFRKRGNCYDVPSCKEATKTVTVEDFCHECGTFEGTHDIEVTVLVCRRCGDEVQPRWLEEERIEQVDLGTHIRGVLELVEQPDLTVSHDLSEYCTDKSGRIHINDYVGGDKGYMCNFIMTDQPTIQEQK